MGADFFGSPVASDDPAALSAIDDMVVGLLGYETRAVRVLAAADAAPGECLLNAYAGLLWMLSETGDVPEAARFYLARARDAAAAEAPREREATLFLSAMIEGDIDAAQAAARRAVAADPRDLLMVKLHHYNDFNRGDFPAMLRIAQSGAEARQDIAFQHGLMAFAFEQCHLLGDAEDAARRALSMRRREPWAQHALAHVMLTQGRIDEGASFLEEMRDSWAGLNSFMYTHHWWHLALFYLSQGRSEQALAAYDEHCWSLQKDFSQDQVGAISLLTRMEFAGIDPGARWIELGCYLAARAGDTSQPFLTLQYLYGLARAGRAETATLHDAVLARGRGGDALWRDLVEPAAEGLLAHAAGNHEQVVRRLAPVMPRLFEIGGSHAQRDLFDQILLDSLLQSGRLVQAQQALELRRQADPDGVPVNRALASVYGRLDLPAQAEAALRRAAATAARHAGAGAR